MRIQNTGKDEAPGGQEYKGSLRLPASEEVYRALRLEGGASFRDGFVEVTITTRSLRDLKARLNSWLRTYTALMGVEKEVEK